jgi:murein DD-endopeptidase MepM/ murein hydrolase activator NlpD
MRGFRWLSNWKIEKLLMLAIGIVIPSGPAAGQINDTLHPRHRLWEKRMQVWQQWARFSEKELFQAYQQTPDSWLREHVPAILPIRVDEGGNRLTSAYGYRKHPISRDWKFHNGIDLSGKLGQNVYATAQGIVQKVGYDPFLGNYIVLSHAGLFTTTYGHLSQTLVKKGQFIYRQVCIGKIGKTGRATGYHLHYIVKRSGKTVDADAYLFLRYNLYSISKSP